MIDTTGPGSVAPVALIGQVVGKLSTELCWVHGASALLLYHARPHQALTLVLWPGLAGHEVYCSTASNTGMTASARDDSTAAEISNIWSSSYRNPARAHDRRRRFGMFGGAKSRARGAPDSVCANLKPSDKSCVSPYCMIVLRRHAGFVVVAYEAAIKLYNVHDGNVRLQSLPVVSHSNF